ncbi:MAG: hypothetical protein JW900_12555 [Anaerolineae bacterium]|nr:hypothetical protein [Anaerolineae bacterium]
MPYFLDLPMCRNLPQPLDARILERHVGVEAAGDGLLDERLLLLGEQLDQPSLRADVAAGEAVDVVEEAGNGGLFAWWWNEARQVFKVAPAEILPKPRTKPVEHLHQVVGMQQQATILWNKRLFRLQTHIGRGDDASRFG